MVNVLANGLSNYTRNEVFRSNELNVSAVIIPIEGAGRSITREKTVGLIDQLLNSINSLARERLEENDPSQDEIVLEVGKQVDNPARISLYVSERRCGGPL